MTVVPRCPCPIAFLGVQSLLWENRFRSLGLCLLCDGGAVTKTEQALQPGTVITLGLVHYGVALLSLVTEESGCLAVLR